MMTGSGQGQIVFSTSWILMTPGSPHGLSLRLSLRLHVHLHRRKSSRMAMVPSLLMGRATPLPANPRARIRPSMHQDSSCEISAMPSRKTTSEITLANLAPLKR